MRRLVRRVFMLSVVAGTAYAVWRWFESQRSESGLSWEAQPAPFPPQPRAENPDPGDAGDHVRAGDCDRARRGAGCAGEWR